MKLIIKLEPITTICLSLGCVARESRSSSSPKAAYIPPVSDPVIRKVSHIVGLQKWAFTGVQESIVARNLPCHCSACRECNIVAGMMFSQSQAQRLNLHLAGE
ncbi:Uncharacterized protein HZ326_23128 [Fusarium oxysporum f. sp. albedinis]|nr:Uncharacterized protein HZ326_23128 [Fusarium oxysporum f. sp. albedinis]